MLVQPVNRDNRGAVVEFLDNLKASALKMIDDGQPVALCTQSTGADDGAGDRAHVGGLIGIGYGVVAEGSGS